MSGARTSPRVLAGRYELDGVIGRGGMGTVHRATDRVLGRQVAVKLLPAAVAQDDPTSVTRFEREARAAAALRHPGVVFVYDAGIDGDERFIVMELVTGPSLDATLRSGPLEPARAARIGSAVADALAAAHAAGIVHRDIKPANVMLGEGDVVKVLDFGIARSEGLSTLTQAASVIGTAAYLAPEVAAGGAADARSDVYALGCVLYAMLTGGPPFRGERLEAIIHQHAAAAPRSPRAANPRIPAALSALTLAMLEKRPGDRPASMAEVRDRLAALAEPADPTAATQVLPAAAPVPARYRGSRRLAPFVALLAVLAAVVGVIVAAGGSGSAHRAAHVSRHHPGTAAAAAARRRQPTTTSSTTTPPPPTTSAASTPASTPTTPVGPSIAQQAAALSAQLAAGVRSGAIDPHRAQDLSQQLMQLVAQAATGPTGDVAHKLSDLAAQIQALTSPAPAPPAGPGKDHGHGKAKGPGAGN